MQIYAKKGVFEQVKAKRRKVKGFYYLIITIRFEVRGKR
jgi:hypothetical protein